MNPNLSSFAQLAAVLSLPPLSPMHCRDCQTTLPLFITDEMAGQPVDILYPQTAVHLDICPTCADEYETLASLTHAAFYHEDAR